ncbi:MAG: UbiD family decarboxylase [Methanomassiliicoccaceae archaeon]|jgi:UbiD family decarboxylase|nr:UbiD family decarboxylase [Methanomassiliicoccaceae archaeon]
MSVRKFLAPDVIINDKKINADSQEITKILVGDQDKTFHFKSLNGGEAVGNLFSTRAKIAEAMNIRPDDIVKHLSSAISNPKQVKVVDKPAFRKNSIPVDLTSLPIPKYFPEDAGRYITAGVIIAEWEGVRNVSFHRMLIAGKNKIAVRLVPRHLYTMHKMAKAAKQDLKVTICVGLRPEVLLAAAISTDYGVDELEIASSMCESSFKKPLEVGKCDNGLLVPADADYVFEARITSKEMDEGPFVDITGTYDTVRSQPIIEVDKIWTSDKPIFHLLLPGGYEHYLFMGLPREPMIFKTVRQAVPRTHAVRLTEGGCCWLHGVVSITKNKEGDGMNAIMAAFTGHPSMKQVIIVDEDIDIFDDRQVEWAVATRFQGNRMLRVQDAAGSSLDPSAEGTTWKVGIDATRPLSADEKAFRKATL